MQRSLCTVLVVGVTLVAALVDVSTAAQGSSGSSLEAKFVSGAAPPLPWIQHGSAYIQLVNVPLAFAPSVASGLVSWSSRRGQALHRAPST